MKPNPHRAQPLGLPAGSVRALLTLLIVTVVVVQFVRDESVGPLWVQTLMIALAHYFTSRRLIDLPPEEQRRLEEQGLLDKEETPLYLPRGTIRAIVVSAFVILTGYLYWQGRLWAADSLGLLLSVFAYFLGLFSKRIVARLLGGRGTPTHRLWRDIKAIVVILLLGIQAGAHLLGVAASVPAALNDITIAVVLFYFGSR